MQRSKFYQFFPPPQFLQMPAVGLDISDISLRFVELVERSKGFEVGRFGERTIPRGVIESGEVKKPSELRAIFTEIKKAYNLEFVSVSLPEERAYLFDLRLPKMKYDNIRGTIELSLEEHVPIKASEALFDYEIIKEDESFIDVSVVAVAQSLVDGYLEAFSGSGITPVAFEIEAHAVARAVVPEGDKNTYLVVDFGKTRTGISIVSEGVVQFTSTISLGSGAITDAIVKNLNIPYEEAEKTKKEKGVSENSENDDLLMAVMSVLSVLRDEISRHQMYWQDHADSHGSKRLAIQKIYLCGGGASLAGLSEYFAQKFSIPIEHANVMVNVNTLESYIPQISFSDSLRFATALGLALRRPR